MYQVEAVKTIPDECQPFQVSRRTFTHGKLSLTVPSILEDRQIRSALRVKSLEDAYKLANAWQIFPPAALRDCIELVFTTPYYDPETGGWKTTEGQYTCVGFWNCFQQYVEGQAAFPEPDQADRRMKIAPGVFSPSENEEKCIRDSFLKQIPLAEAFEECGAADIIPGWPGALQLIETAYITAMGQNKPFPPLYEIIKRSHQVSAIQPPPVPPPVSPPVSPPPEDKDKKTSKAVYYVIGAIALLILSEGE